MTYRELRATLADMWLKCLSLALVASALLLAAVASGAEAAAVTSKAEWYTGAKETSVTTLEGSQSFTVSVPEKRLYLRFRVAFEPIEMEAKSATCVECVITNEAPGHLGVATGTGKLVFNEVTFFKLPACKLKENKVTTEPLFFEAHYKLQGPGEHWEMRISPASGEVDLTLNIEQSGSESTCPYVGSGQPVKGSSFAEFKPKTGTFLAEPTLLFSPEISEGAGSSWQFKGEPFWLFAGLAFNIGGNFFGVK